MNPSDYGLGATRGISANVVPRVSQVQQEVERGAKLMSCIEEKIKSLYARLQSVLSDNRSDKESTGPSPKPMLVGHAVALSNHNDQLDQTDRALGDILDRLEL